MKSFISNIIKSMMKQLKETVFIILIAFNLFHLSDSQPPCITPPLPSLKAQGEFCKDSSECVSYVCKNNVCTCHENTYFDLCTQSCVINCNSTVKVETSGHIVRLPRSNTSQQSQYCTWSLEAPAGSFILFRTSYLDLKSSDTCSTDFIEVYDGQGPRYRFCQSNETDPKVVASASNTLDITYQESSPGHYGFIGSYYLYTHNSVTRDRFGYIASPRYPQKYPPNYVVSWTIDGGEEVINSVYRKWR
ncbi:unnamed protein product [Lymnaea stagnalis]|uniref:CUB domain-containing protein n=1 Tax=Lymnaea stagnalis TaxID=6523 RepID=A0AAV2ILD7_LYMST